MYQKVLAFIGVALCSFFTNVNPVAAQGTAFTYQGQLTVGGIPADGSYDLAFSLFDTNTDGTQIGMAITNAATANPTGATLSARGK